MLLSGCAGDRKPNVPQFITGIEKSKEWIDYNSYAKLNNEPKLDFVATPILYTRSGKVTNYDTFLPTDPRATIQTKWSNVKPTDIFEFEFITPDGRLYEYAYSKPKKASTSKWTIGRAIYIKGMPTEDILGKWSVKVYANGKYVLTKKFIIGKMKNHENTLPTTTIGFAPYWNSKMSTWNHSKSAAKYISEALIRDNDNVLIIPVSKILKEAGNPNLSYEQFEQLITEDLEDNNGIINSLTKKIKMDYLVLGTVESKFGSISHDTHFKTFIVDVKKRKIIKTIDKTLSLSRSDFNIANNQSTKAMHPLRVQIYKELYNLMKIDLKSIIKQ
jgi:hypothetical protein